MLGDESRGWAWTRALLGVAANEIHICGDASAIKLLVKLAKDMGESLEVRPLGGLLEVAVLYLLHRLVAGLAAIVTGNHAAVISAVKVIVHFVNVCTSLYRHHVVVCM